MSLLLVALGALVGAPARLLVGRALPGAPGTLAVNVLASLALGLLLGTGPSAYALLGTGFCGAFGTFSTFAVEAVDAAEDTGRWYAPTTLVLCLGAAALGTAVT